MRTKRSISKLLREGMIVAGLFCIVIFAFLTIFINAQSEKTINSVGGIYMQSMNERISKHFTTMVDMRLGQLNTLVETMPDGAKSDGEMMREWLAYNGQIRGFEALCYFFEDGTQDCIYGSPVTALNAGTFQRNMMNGEKTVSVGIDEQGERAAVIGIPYELELADGTKTSAIVGRMPLDYISETLALDDEEALLYSYVIRSDGSFVVRSGATRETYFDRVRALYTSVEGKADVEQYIAELKEAIKNKEDYSAMFTIDGERRQLYCSSLPSSEWYLITVLPYSTLNEAITAQGRQTLLLFFLCCTAIILVLLFIFARYFKMNKAQLLELEQARQNAEDANRSKSEFLSNMSHDIRTPMNAIVGMTTIALTNVDDRKRVSDCLKKIMLSSKHLLGLINDVLDMSKIESGKMVLNMELVSLREIMDSVVSIVQPQIKAKNQHFNVFIYNITSENVLCDSVRLNQILLNLMSNAIKFTPEGGSIEIALHETPSPKGGNYARILIQVRDTGIGMSEDFQKRIFESFTREDNKRVQKTEGTGLGMAITKYIVDAMGGEIEVRSEQGKGTEFNVTLDFEQAEQQEEDMILPDFMMLVVDDDRQLCESTAASLKSIGVRADWTLDGESAIELVEQHHNKHNDYHVILLDYKLPGIDGIDTARKIRKELGDDVPILLISAYDFSEIEEDAREAGINGFLAKPLFKSTLYYGLKPFIDGVNETVKQAKELDNFSGRRVLLAEDNELNWEIASELLKDLGLELEWAENGQIAVDMFQNSAPGYYDAILMDIRMPVMDGFHATEAIRAMKDRPDVSLPIIAMTADAFYEDVQQCLRHGMNAHVAKPIDIKEVSRMLNRFLNAGENG